ncbi:MAG: hypothetical protein QME90_17330 [Thermodesulfobacteriota bacterium]|nr:hypothetical protein [Thermodesulfobacteriota bacterium]
MEKNEEILKRYGERVGYHEDDLEKFKERGYRVRHVRRLSQASPQYTIEAEVVKSRHCNSGYKIGDKFIMDVDGNFISKLCPKRMCVYLISQLTIPVALINERLSEGLDPNQFHFMHEVRCPDVGVDCSGYGEVMLRVGVVPRQSG